MKIKLVSTLIFLSTFHLISTAQFSGLGINGKFNASRHFMNNLNLKPKFAYSVTDILPSFGGGVFADYCFSERWKIRVNVNYETKGFSTKYLTTTGQRIDKIKFNNISTDAKAIMNIGANKNVQPYITAGLSASYLTNVKLDTWQYEIFGEDAYKQELGFDYYDYAKLSLSGLLGFGLNIRNIVWIETTYCHDIIAPINRSNIKVYNRLWAANIGVNILEIVRKYKG